MLPKYLYQIFYHMNSSLKSLLVAAPLLVASVLHAQVQVSVTQFTDSATYSVSNSDLLQTNLASASIDVGGFSNAFFGQTLGRLYDGNFGDPRTDYDSVVGFSDGTKVVFAFDLSANAQGYDLTKINTYVGWDNGRDGQEYTVEYSLASSPTTFLSLASVPRFATEMGSGFPTRRTSVTIESSVANAVMVANVAALRFNFTDFENGGSGYREFDVLGAAAVPEPGTFSAMAGLATLGFAQIRRRRRS